MERILNQINQKLREHKIELDILAVQAEYLQVHHKWLQVVNSIKAPIKYLIIGEATVSWANYFYNEQAKTTSFLNPSHFDKTNKADLIKYFKRRRILVFDLYPLPLPTFIYDNIKFDCSDSLYNQALKEYFDQVEPFIDDKTKIVIRYTKLEDRGEFNLFRDIIIHERNKIITIGGTSANESEIRKIFNLKKKK
jgi:hypothetical protein